MDRGIDNYSKLVEELARMRDEIKLQIHLGSKELQAEFTRIEDRWTKFENEAKVDQSVKDVSDAIKFLAEEIREAFSRIRKAL